MDLDALFGVHVPIAELLLRGTCVYWLLFLLFRFVLRRDVGALGIADLLLLVIVADAAQNAMSGGYGSITEGALLVGTIVAWNVAIDWLAYRSRAFDRFAKPRALQLIRHGRVVRENLARELLTMDDLMEELRHHGVSRVEDVRHAFMESDGRISVIATTQRTLGERDSSSKAAP